MPTIPRLLERHSHQVVMTIRSKADVRRYRIGAANTLDVAFAGTTPMFDVYRDRMFRSPSIRQRRIGFTQESYRGLTKVHYDPQDYQGGVVPGDAAVSFVRVIEEDNAGTLRPEGPILVVPPSSFMNTMRPSMTMSGTAPNVAATTTGLPPAGAMHVVIPRYADNVRIRNLGAASLLISFDPGQPEVELPTGESQIFYDGTLSELFIRGDGAAVAFDAYFALVNGTLE
jgi:hypothetical protein